MKIKRLLCCLVLLLGAAALHAQPVAPPPAAAGAESAPRDVRQLNREEITGIADGGLLKRLAAGYAKIGDGERLTWTYERLHELYPNVGDYAPAGRPACAQGRQDAHLRHALKMKEQGYGYDRERQALEKVITAAVEVLRRA